MTALGPLFTFGTDDTTNRARVLTLLSDGRPHSTLELVAVGGTRGPARVHELRREGYDIRCEGERGRYRYRLVGRRDVSRRLSRREVERLCVVWRAAL